MGSTAGNELIYQYLLRSVNVISFYWVSGKTGIPKITQSIKTRFVLLFFGV